SARDRRRQLAAVIDLSCRARDERDVLTLRRGRRYLRDHEDDHGHEQGDDRRSARRASSLAALPKQTFHDVSILPRACRDLGDLRRQTDRSVAPPEGAQPQADLPYEQRAV